MAFQSNNPFYGNNSGMAPVNGDYQRLALDNLIRRELKISDPGDPAQIAQALLERYRDDPRANAISQEAKGLPFLQTLPSASSAPMASTSSAAELAQAKDDVERDLNELTTNSLLKDVTPEIQGWGQAVRSAIAEGTNAARFGLDPRQRDKAMAIRRQLGDYARLARLIGALTPTLNMTYRKFAQSLDEVAAVILVMMGEALANAGFNGGRFLLQAPYTELQVRRDAAIYALRNLVGSTQQAYGPNDWPRGLDAYRRLYDLLEKQGQGDLRALLVEHELSRTMDELIMRAQHGNADGLRALGSTAQIDLERFRRLVIVGRYSVSPESPPLTAFLESLQLFADAFTPSGGFRLMRIARPPILFYGLYGTTALDKSDHRLLELILLRGQLADALDCFRDFYCATNSVKYQAVLDKILYDLDRSIDLYAMGKEDFGEPERRAFAYRFIIDSFVNRIIQLPKTDADSPPIPPSLYNKIGAANSQLVETGYLVDIREKLTDGFNNALNGGTLKPLISDILTFADDVLLLLQNKDNKSVLISPIKSFILDGNGKLKTNLGKLDEIIKVITLSEQGAARLEQLEVDNVPNIPQSILDYFGILQQELCIQESFERQWRQLVKSMAPNCYGVDDVLDYIELIVNDARETVSGDACTPYQPSIPPHFETSLDSIADDIDRRGFGRD